MNDKIDCAECRNYHSRTFFCKRSEKTVRPRFGCYEGEMRVVTNGDFIRKMSDEQLAEWMNKQRQSCPDCQCLDENCISCWMNWLKRRHDPEDKIWQ